MTERYAFRNTKAMQSVAFTRGASMKYLIIAACSILLSACVSAPADLYGVHQAKPQAQDIHYASVSHEVDADHATKH
jgi:starvation-inducible outer membrane lipoprotein